jgi:hypothetical protein
MGGSERVRMGSGHRGCRDAGEQLAGFLVLRHRDCCGGFDFVGLIEDIKLYRIYRKEKPDIDVLEEAIRMNGSKPWWQSEGIWAGIYTVIVGTVPLIDKQFGTTFASSPFYAILVSLGGVVAVHGRATATAQITASGPAVPPTTGG